MKKKILGFVLSCAVALSCVGCGTKEYKDYFSYDLKYNMQLSLVNAKDIEVGDKVSFTGYLYRSDDHGPNKGNSYNGTNYSMVTINNFKGKAYETNCLILIKDKNLEIPLESLECYEDKLYVSVKGTWSKEDYNDTNKNRELLVVEEIEYLDE